MGATTKKAQIRLTRRAPGYLRVTFDNPPLNVMGPEFVLQIRQIMNALEADKQVEVVVFDSAVEGFFLNHSDFLAKLEDLTAIPFGGGIPITVNGTVIGAVGASGGSVEQDILVARAALAGM